MDFILDPSLVLYLPLHKLDGSALMSKDAYGHLAMVTGALWTPQGRTFDGIDDFITAGNPASLQLTGAFSLEAWFKPATISGNGKGIITKGDVVHSAPPVSFTLFQSAANVVFEVLDQTNVARIGYYNSVLIAGEWVHLVATYDGGTTTAATKIYANGALVPLGTDQATGTFVSITASTHDLDIGRGLLNGSNIYNDSTIGEARIYTRALTLAEVIHNYLATKWRYR